jgi:hypothetical protein
VSKFSCLFHKQCACSFHTSIKHGYSARRCYCKLTSRAHTHGCSTQIPCTKLPKVFRIIFRVVDKTATFQSLNFTKLNDFKHFATILKVIQLSHCTSTLLSKPVELVMLTAVMTWIYEACSVSKAISRVGRKENSLCLLWQHCCRPWSFTCEPCSFDSGRTDFVWVRLFWNGCADPKSRQMRGARCEVR